MRFDPNVIGESLSGLRGLRIEQMYHAASLRGICFVPVNGEVNEDTEWFLHLECPWRMEKGDEVLTGNGDWWLPAAGFDSVPEDWDPAEGGSVQEAVLRRLLDDPTGNARQIYNRSSFLVVREVTADACGGAVIRFDEGYRLVVFPNSTFGESWRVFQRGDGRFHYVVEGEDTHRLGALRTANE